MDRYVAGFLFNESGSRLALIHKTRGPAAVVGHWTGIGGKIEDGETCAEAMQREFREEAGVLIDDWELFLILIGKGWQVNFYHAFDAAVELVEKQEEEDVRVFSMSDHPDIVPNLRWILPMALGHLDDHVRIYEVMESSIL